MKLFFKIFIISLLFTTSTFSFFNDVSQLDSEFEAIRFLNHINWIKGYKDWSFKKDKLISRVEFLKIFIESRAEFWEVENCIKNNLKNSYEYVFFKDVPRDEWFSKYVCIAKIYGYVKGYPDWNFRPHSQISYAEASSIILRSFTSIKLNTVWYLPYINKIKELKAVPSSNPFPATKLTRWDASEMIFKTYNNGTYPIHFFESLHNITFYYTESWGLWLDVIENKDFINIVFPLKKWYEKYCYKTECFVKNSKRYMRHQYIRVVKKDPKDTIEKAVEKFTSNNENIDFSKCELVKNSFYKMGDFDWFNLSVKKEFMPTREDMIEDFNKDENIYRYGVPMDSKDGKEVKMLSYTHFEIDDWNYKKQFELCWSYSAYTSSRQYPIFYNKNRPDIFLIIQTWIESDFIILKSIKFDI